MQATIIEFETQNGKVRATRNYNAYVQITVTSSDDDVLCDETFAITDFASLHRSARKVMKAVGIETPSPKSVTDFCQALQPLMSSNSVLQSLANK